MAVSSMLYYLSQTQKTGLERLLSIQFYHENQYMNLDLIARRNLELTQTMRTGEKRGFPFYGCWIGLALPWGRG